MRLKKITDRTNELRKQKYNYVKEQPPLVSIVESNENLKSALAKVKDTGSEVKDDPGLYRSTDHDTMHEIKRQLKHAAKLANGGDKTLKWALENKLLDKDPRTAFEVTEERRNRGRIDVEQYFLAHDSLDLRHAHESQIGEAAHVDIYTPDQIMVAITVPNGTENAACMDTAAPKPNAFKLAQELKKEIEHPYNTVGYRDVGAIQINGLQNWFTRSKTQCTVKPGTIGIQILTIANPLHYLQNTESYKTAHGTLYLAFFDVPAKSQPIKDFFHVMNATAPLGPTDRNGKADKRPHSATKFHLGYLPLWTEYYRGGIEAAYKQYLRYRTYLNANIIPAQSNDPDAQLAAAQALADNPCAVLDAAS